MQRQLLQIADKIPDDIVLTLLKSFAKILSREPEPTPKTPFIRAFAKIRDDDIDRQFLTIPEEDEHVVKEYDSGNEVETFKFKVTTNTEEIAYSLGSHDQGEIFNSEATEDVMNDEQLQNEIREFEEIAENIDEGIEVEMPKLLPADEEADQNASDEIVVASSEVLDENQIENASEIGLDQTEVTETTKKLEVLIEEPEEILIEEVVEEEEIYPTEAAKVTLDDIQREIEDMQNFLFFKGVDPEKKKKEEERLLKKQAEEALKQESKNIEDAYQVDVCIKLKNKNNSHKKHHHSKYLRSENYREEVIEEGPIFDPAVPNTQEDFMKVKTVSEKIHKKKQKVHPTAVSWQNLVEDQKKSYKHTHFDKSKKNVAEQQKNIKFN